MEKQVLVRLKNIQYTPKRILSSIPQRDSPPKKGTSKR